MSAKETEPGAAAWRERPAGGRSRELRDVKQRWLTRKAF